MFLFFFRCGYLFFYRFREMVVRVLVLFVMIDEIFDIIRILLVRFFDCID